jgi:hypothetical protein
VTPQRREEGLFIEELADETLVYDRSRHKVHCLNRTAALVWKHCDGKTSVAALDRRLRKELGVPAAEDIVRLTIEQLTKARLLQETLPQSSDVPRYSRREVARKVASVLLPVVITVAAPTVAMAATCTPQGGNCITSSDCCPIPGVCCRVVGGIPPCKPGSGSCI